MTEYRYRARPVAVNSWIIDQYRGWLYGGWEPAYGSDGNHVFTNSLEEAEEAINSLRRKDAITSEIAAANYQFKKANKPVEF